MLYREKSICKKCYIERKVYLYYIFFCVCFGIPEKPSLRLMNRPNFLKQVQHFNAHNFYQKKEKGKKKEINSVNDFSEHMHYYETF